MKTVGLEHTTLEVCIKDARRERVVVTRKGKPVALVVGVEGLDEAQIQLGSSEKFRTLIEARRRQKTVSRTELERRIKDENGSMEATEEKHKTRARQPTPNPYQASGIERADGCTARRRGGRPRNK